MARRRPTARTASIDRPSPRWVVWTVAAGMACGLLDLHAAVPEHPSGDGGVEISIDASHPEESPHLEASELVERAICTDCILQRHTIALRRDLPHRVGLPLPRRRGITETHAVAHWSPAGPAQPRAPPIS